MTALITPNSITFNDTTTTTTACTTTAFVMYPASTYYTVNSSTSNFCWTGGAVDYGTSTSSATSYVIRFNDSTVPVIFDSTDYWVNLAPRSPSDALRDIIKSRCAPRVLTSKGVAKPQDVREMRARQTLRRILGDAEFRRFLKKGFISVKAKSGLVYQLFPGYRMAKVYKDGQLIESICIQLPSDFPPTDTLIMRYFMVLHNEEEFRKIGNICAAYGGSFSPYLEPERPQSLTEIFRNLKGT